jgi:hypothetical protein
MSSPIVAAAEFYAKEIEEAGRQLREVDALELEAREAAYWAFLPGLSPKQKHTFAELRAAIRRTRRAARAKLKDLWYMAQEEAARRQVGEKRLQELEYEPSAIRFFSSCYLHAVKVDSS